jgi:hypothetical protein
MISNLLALCWRWSGRVLPAALLMLAPAWPALADPFFAMHYIAAYDQGNYVTVHDPKNFTEFEYESPRFPKAIKSARAVRTLLGDTIIVSFGDKTPPTLLFPGDFKTVPRVGARAAVIVSNDADTLDVACDGKYAVVVGANSATPVSLIDLGAQREVATLAYPGKLARAVAVDEEGTQALVVLDTTPIESASTIRRLTITPQGGLVDTGEQLAYGAEYVSRVSIAPGGKTGVAVVGFGTSRLVTFALPGLAVRGSTNLTGGTGNAVAFSPDGDRVYVRSGRRAVAPDVIESFVFDPNTGVIGQAATLTISGLSGFTGVIYQTSMAITSDGTSLVVAEENSDGRLPAPRIAVFNPANGALQTSKSLAQGAKPQIVATPRACKSMSATQTAIEYYHAAFDHYFATSIADEITKLDNGTFAGWARTGKQFNVFANGAAGTVPTCRFFSTSFGLKSSHFYATSASECATVKANPNWEFEGEVFATQAPAADGTCVPPNVPLYRLYNNSTGGAPNHRYTTQTDVRTQMIAQGWIPEGLGIGVVACLPP